AWSGGVVSPMPFIHTPDHLSRRKTALFTVVMFLGVWAFIETAGYVFLQAAQTRFNIFYGLRPPTDAELDLFAAIAFHPVLGWDLPKLVERGHHDERISHPYTTTTRYKTKAFGDSFTQGGPDHDGTYEYFVEEQTGWQYLNYGVSGYGPDQALLKYQANVVKTDFTTLGILDENIGRVVNRLRGFYTFQESFRSKPRYIVQTDGSVVLLPNPIQDPRDLRKLQDRDYVEELRKQDYWSTYHERLNAPYDLRWPVSSVILPHFDFFAGQTIRLIRHAIHPSYETHLWRSRYYHLYETGSEGIKILRHIVDEFAAIAQSRGEVPIVLVFPAITTMDVLSEYGRKVYQPLVDHLTTQGVEFIDFGDVFLRERAYNEFYRDEGHFNATGNRIVAREIVTRIQQLDSSTD
ncbi:MAG: hypothetical protein ACRD1T_12055, partial [Acidimicrobiia bacterium]